MNDQKAIWRSLVSGPCSGPFLRKVMWRMASGLSEITGRPISNDDPVVDKVPITQVYERAKSPKERMVGVYLVIGGGLRGQAILILPMSSALNLADLAMGEEPGTATALGLVERLALSEIGNMAVSYFLNGVASLDDVPDLLRPSPPAVMVDMMGDILNVIVTSVAAVRDDLVIIETAFKDIRGTVQGRLWVLPDPTIQDLAI